MSENLNLKTITTIDPSPFKHLCVTIGELPSTFVESMSYYECLAWLVSYLENTVIPAVNQNGEACAELQAAFIELKTFVDDYFDNLDVQEEINNKLDSMAEEGTLQEIIADYLKTQLIYETTLDMIDDADHLTDGVYVETLGYRTKDDNGASFFEIKNTGTADGYSVIDLENGLYAHMIYKHDYVTPEMFGAYGDGINDHNDSDAIQYAINTGKTVEFAPKTYMCFDLEIEDVPVTLHGNGATLKRPELDIDPYNKTVDQMKWTRTLNIHEDCIIKDLNFDNNCFTMWQVSDGYAQEQSASVIAGNDSKKIRFNIDNCNFKNSAGDGLHIVTNVIAQINNCTSADCFRGGFVSTGYGSEINLNGWNSRVITSGVNDGFDVEVDSASSIDPNTYKLNINNVIMDYDLDLGCPAYGEINVNNLIMRTFDGSKNGFTLNTNGGEINISNSVLRRGTVSGSVNQRNSVGGKIKISNSKLIGIANNPIFSYVTPKTDATNYESLTIDNCDIECYDFIYIGIIYGYLNITNNRIKCTNSLILNSGAVEPQPNHLNITNCDITFGSVLARISKTSYATFDDGVNINLNNLRLKSGETSTEIASVGGKPNIYYSALICDTPLLMHKTGGSNPVLIGTNRIVTVATATDLTFAGWVAGNDIAIAKDTGARYTYTSGTSWTAQ